MADVNGGSSELSILTQWGRHILITALGAATSTEWHPEEDLQAASFVPDTTGDGVPDAAFGGNDHLRLVNGQTQATVFSSPWPDYPDVPPPDEPLCIDNAPRVSLPLQPCIPPPTTRSTRAPLAVRGDGARVFALNAASDGALEVAAFTPSGAAAWNTPVRWFADAGTLAPGTNIFPRLAVGDSNGKARLLNADDAAETWQQDVGALTGIFTWRWDVASGSFLGSYIVEAELTWDDEDALGDAFTQTARLLTLLDLADEHDLHPTYAVSLAAWRQEWKEE